MFDHIGLHVRDLDASIKFYTAVLAPFGHVLGSRDDTSAGFGPPGAPSLWLYAAKAKSTGIHLALSTTKRALVDKFHAAGIEARRPVGQRVRRYRARVTRRRPPVGSL